MKKADVRTPDFMEVKAWGGGTKRLFPNASTPLRIPLTRVKPPQVMSLRLKMEVTRKVEA